MDTHRYNRIGSDWKDSEHTFVPTGLRHKVNYGREKLEKKNTRTGTGIPILLQPPAFASLFLSSSSFGPGLPSSVTHAGLASVGAPDRRLPVRSNHPRGVVFWRPSNLVPSPAIRSDRDRIGGECVSMFRCFRSVRREREGTFYPSLVRSEW